MISPPAARRAGLILTTAFALGACGRPAPPPPPAPQAISLSAARVEPRSMAGGLTATGTLTPRQEAAVSSELAGYRIAAVEADEDQWVAKGQPLVRLDDALLKAQMAQQKAALAAQEVAVQRAQAEADRVKGLDNAGVLSEEQILERRLAARAALAQLQVSKAQLQDLQTRDDRLVIRAPAAGRVLEKDARPGDTSAGGTTLFRIAVDGLVELDAEVSQSDLGRIAPGEAAEVELPSGARVEGRVRFISPRVDPQTGLGHVRIALPRREDLRPGGFGRAVFATAGRPTPAVPETAVRFDAVGPSVVVIDAQDRVHRVAVKTGRRAKGYVELLEGPPVGTRVALSGGAFVLDGDVVRVAGETRPAEGAT